MKIPIGIHIRFENGEKIPIGKRNSYRPLAHDVTAPVTMHLEDKLAIYA